MNAVPRHRKFASTAYRVNREVVDEWIVGHHPRRASDGVDMPRIPQALLDASFYLYASREDAKAGGQAGGTGLFVGVPFPNDPGRMVIYAVSKGRVLHQHAS